LSELTVPISAELFQAKSTFHQAHFFTRKINPFFLKINPTITSITASEAVGKNSHHGYLYVFKSWPMKKVALLFFLLPGLQAQANYWTQKADFGGIVRGAATGFSIGTKGYIGCGIDFSSAPALKKDFWEYNPASNTWTQKANFGGTARSGAVGFSIGTKGYIACGFDNAVKNDMWEYDQASNAWTAKASFGGVPRDYAVAFALGGMGYLGTGYNAMSTNYNDFWQYNPSSNTWTQKANVGGGPRSSAFGFAANGKGYIGNGYDAGPKNDMWEYNPATNLWTQKANVPGGLRSDGVGFSIGNLGYIGTGDVGSVSQNDFWEYDPLTNAWTQRANLTGLARSDAVGFSIGIKGYIGTGYDPVFNRLKDFWEYTPNPVSLPVELLSFTATPLVQEVEIKWVTASETNNDFFTVERSVDGKQFHDIGKVEGASNCTGATDYLFLDRQPAKGHSYYRLKQTDFDGMESWSKPAAVYFKNSEISYHVFPNPATGSFTVRPDHNLIFDLAVTDISGRQILDMKKVTEQAVIDCSGFPAGNYFVRTDHEGGSAVYRISVRK